MGHVRLGIALLVWSWQAFAGCPELVLGSRIPLSKWTRERIERLEPGGHLALDEAELGENFRHGDLTFLVSTATDPKESGPHVVLFGTGLDEQSRAVATWTAIYRRPANRPRHLEITGVYIDTDPDAKVPRGLSRTLVSFLQTHVVPALKIEEFRGIADYAGRYVWATHAHDFRLADRGWQLERQDGTKADPWIIAKENFGRFLAKHGVAETDLCVRTPAACIPVTLDEITTVRQLAKTEAVSGKLVEVAPLIAETTAVSSVIGTVQPFPVGKAFFLVDYAHAAGEPWVAMPWGQQLNTYSMPPFPFVGSAQSTR